MREHPLNIVLLAGRFQVRGTTNYTLRLAENLHQFGVRPTIICSDARGIDPARLDGLDLREFRNVDVPVIGRLLREWIILPFQDDTPDLIHVQSRQMLGLGTWLARRLHRPLVLTIHDFPPPGRKQSFNRQFGRKIIAVSESVRDAVMTAYGLTADDVVVIHSGVESNDNPSGSPVLDPEHIPVVGTAGPLEAVKGIPFFLAAAAKVNAVRDDVQFLIAGAGPEEHNLRRLARRLKIDRQVTFAPNLRDFGQSIAAVDIFCLPSLQQGLGTIMLDAMAMGKPVIASGVGGIHSIIRDGQNGLLVPPSQSEPIAERILGLLNDPVQARAIGEAGRAFVRSEFRVETMVDWTAALYHAILKVWQPKLQKAK